ncbi:MAG: hypothetical protein M2R45_05262 [Verrucomicrobia subdivision 3 bacterium]|nr:hypothetical protein [Limisphaerales bacterium]
MMAAVAGPSENQGNRRAAFGWLKPDAVLCAYSLGAETNPVQPKESQRLNLENPEIKFYGILRCWLFWLFISVGGRGQSSKSGKDGRGVSVGLG